MHTCNGGAALYDPGSSNLGSLWVLCGILDTGCLLQRLISVIATRSW